MEKLHLESDEALVRRLAHQGSAAAFSILAHRYSEGVFNACRRVLRNDSDAADVSQETFYQLIKDADRITGSVPSWLHRVATWRSVDLIRQKIARRQREESYAQEAIFPSAPSIWAEVEPALDKAIDQLPDELRELVVLHYLERQPMTQIALRKGLSQPTISRRISRAVELLKQNLQEQGIHLGLVPVQTVLLRSLLAVPEELKYALGKMALAKAAAGPAGGAAAGGILTRAATKTLLAGATVAGLVVAIWIGLGPHPARKKPVGPGSPPSAPIPALSRPVTQKLTAEASVFSSRSAQPRENKPPSLAASSGIVLRPPIPQPVVSRNPKPVGSPSSAIVPRQATTIVPWNIPAIPPTQIVRPANPRTVALSVPGRPPNPNPTLKGSPTKPFSRQPAALPVNGLQPVSGSAPAPPFYPPSYFQPNQIRTITTFRSSQKMSFRQNKN